jgi:prefoldin subunit 5|tara:strand:+ start:169 stop:405 length:237 start_codon:yes stop_codon:yes gene_type:complete
MTEQQQHLQSVIQQSQTLVGEINKLNEEVASKRAMLTKLQGVAEYLDQIGVKLPAEGEEEAAEAPAEAAPAEVVAEGE